MSISRAAGVLRGASAATCLLLGVVACDAARARAPEQDSHITNSVARARQDSINRAQLGYVIDSVHSVEEELRRFREAIGGTPAVRLVGGNDSRTALVARFVLALAARDTADVRAMSVSAREFADLFYPTSPYTRPPYRQAVGLVWFQTQNASSVGITRLFARRGGRSLEVTGHSCLEPPDVHGDNRLWNGCTVEVRGEDGSVRSQHLFGSILERNGQFKFLSYANRL